MICKHCGSPASEDLALCPACGAALEETVQPLSDGAEQLASPEESSALTAALDGEADGREEDEAREALAPYADDGPEVLWDSGSDNGPPPEVKRRRGLAPFLVSLGLVLALGAGAFFLFFADSFRSDEGMIRSVFNRLIAQTKAGNLSGAENCLTPELRGTEGDLLLLGVQDGVAASLAEGAFGRIEAVDAGDAGTVMRAAARQLNFTAEITKIKLDEAAINATVYFSFAFDLPGGRNVLAGSASVVKQNGRWLVSGYSPLFLAPEELPLTALFARFTSALKAGDLSALNDCLPSVYRFEDGLIPLFGSTEEVRGMAEAGALGDVSGLDLNDEGALTRLCVSFYQRELILTGVAVETDEYASLSVLDCITYEGDNSVENMDVYYGVIEDGVWYLT